MNNRAIIIERMRHTRTEVFLPWKLGSLARSSVAAASFSVPNGLIHSFWRVVHRLESSSSQPHD